MSNKEKIHDLHSFPIGAVVSVVGVPDYEGITIQRISDSGVTVKGPKCGSDIVISGRTPTIIYVKQDKIMENTKIESVNTEVTNKNVDSSIEETSNRAARGSLKAKMAAIQIPEGAFTVKQLADLNGVPPSYANKWVKDNCKEAGTQAKQEGKRGRVAALFVV